MLTQYTATPTSSPFPPAGKGGCWTCRVRRKKCDEQPENGSCHTCRRLRIECLGWGARRPDWMRDKEKVAAYKAQIKRQLSSQGMIRGQPRSATVTATVTASPVQYQYPEQRFNPVDTGSDENDDYPYSRSISANTSPAYHTMQVPQLTPDISHGISALDLRLFPTPGIPNVPLPPSQFSSNSPHLMGGDIYAVPSQNFYQPTRSPPQHIKNRDEHIQYFFRRVQQLHFLFSSGPSMESIYRDIVTREPDGVVATSLCALAALHQSQVRVADGLEDPSAENSCHMTAIRFYEEAWWQLTNQQQGRQYSENEATAAIHLTSFCLYNGNQNVDWRGPFQIACDWLQTTPVNIMQNPRFQWLQLSVCARYTAQMTMWFDITSSVASNITPRFMDLYRRLFRTDQNQNFWPHSPHAHISSLHMENLTGCPDSVMYALAETACLANWKAQQISTCSLSTRELVRRADIIDHDLRAAWFSTSPGEPFPQLLDFTSAGGGYDAATAGAMNHHAHHHGNPSVGAAAVSAASSVHQSPAHGVVELAVHSHSVGVAGGLSTPVSPVYNSRSSMRLVSQVFYESAMLYLNAVVSGHYPAVPEVQESVQSVIQALHKLDSNNPSPSRGLVFPIAITACLTDVPEQRSYFKQLIEGSHAPMHRGMRVQTMGWMEAVWRKRDAEGGRKTGSEWSAVLAEVGGGLFVG